MTIGMSVANIVFYNGQKKQMVAIIKRKYPEFLAVFWLAQVPLA